MTPIPQDTSCQAEYSDGFILDETEHGDVSPYNSNQNILRAIIDKDPESEHGKMVRFSVFYKNQRHDVDWTNLPDNARPIRFRDGQIVRDMGSGEESFSWTGVHFGYQYNDDSGKNVKEVVDL